MPYIAIKAYPKDEKTQRAVVEKINAAVLEAWGCPQEAVTISLQSIEREDWQQTVVEREIAPNMDNMMIVAGKRTARMGE